MAFLQKSNNVTSTINMGGGLSAGATSLTVTNGSLYPSTGDFMITIWDGVTYRRAGLDPGMEICRATARSGNVITIIRAQENTSDVTHSNGDNVDMMITAGTLNEAFNQNLKTGDSVFFATIAEIYPTLLKLDQTGPQIITSGAPIFDEGLKSNGDIIIGYIGFKATACPLVHGAIDYTFNVGTNANDACNFLYDKNNFSIIPVTKLTEPVGMVASGVKDFGVVLVRVPSVGFNITFYFKNSDFVGGTSPVPANNDPDYFDTWLDMAVGTPAACVTDYFAKSVWTANGATSNYTWANPGGKSLVATYTNPPTLNYYDESIFKADTVTGVTTINDTRQVLSGTVNRDANNLITSLVKTGGRTLTPTRNASNFITSITDGTKTWTFTRNASNFITSWTVT